MERIGFRLRELLLGWRFVTINLGILVCYDSQEEVLVISDFMQWFNPINSHYCCFWLSSNQQRYKLCGYLLFVAVHYESLTCSI